MKQAILAAGMAALLAAAGLGAARAFARPGDTPPPGATALCRDGTYSYSQTRSGTCSHHGGVAVWLNGSGTTATTTTSTTTPSGTTTAAPGEAASGYLSGFSDSGTAHVFTLCFATFGATVTSGHLDWGDGASQDVGASASDVTHTYTYGGTYTITLTCADSIGSTWSQTLPLTVTGPARPAPATSPTTVALGKTVYLGRRTKTSGCHLGDLPDRRCSPGAYYSGLTTAVICSLTFRTSAIRNVPQSEKSAVEREYGLAAKSYGRTLEIDHIVSLELGGSNDIANLFPEKATLPRGAPGYHVKDKLENRLHAMVCTGAMSLQEAQRGIASNWEAVYRKVYGVAP